MYVKLMPQSNKTERLIIWPKITWLDPKRLRGSVFPRLPLRLQTFFITLDWKEIQRWKRLYYVSLTKTHELLCNMTYFAHYVILTWGQILTMTIQGPAGLVAQSVERWTPRGERTRPGEKDPGLEPRRALDVYEPPGGYGYGWWQAVARWSQWGDRPCTAMCVR